VLLRADLHDRTADHAALRELVAAVSGCAVGTVRLDQRCGHCGAEGHGPLRVSGTPVPTAVSLSRAEGVVALATTTGRSGSMGSSRPMGSSGPSLGIDVERVGAVAAARVDVGTPRELRQLGRTADEHRATTRLWTAKEAVLKRDGRGLRVDPRSFAVRWRGDLGRVRWPGGPGWVRDVRVRSVLLGDDLVLAVATDGTAIVDVTSELGVGAAGRRTLRAPGHPDRRPTRR
jgi:4'-phosphopantetheinyl transferase